MDPITLAIIAGTAYMQWRVAKKNRDLQQEQNAKDFEQTKELMKVTRQQALDDRTYENTYNDPKQVMERYRQAGLNPNLIYGKGAEMAAASTRPTAVPNINREAPVLDINPAQLTNQIGSTIGQYYNVQAIQAKTDNTIADTRLKEKEALNKDAQLVGQLTNNARSKFDLEQAQALKNDVLENARLSNEAMKVNIQKGLVDITKTNADIGKIQADTQYTIAENARKEQMQGFSIQESIARAAKLQSEIAAQTIINATNKIEQDIARERLEQAKFITDQAMNDAVMKRIEADMAREGVFKTDPFYVRKVIKELSDNYQKTKTEQRKFFIDQERWNKPDGTQQR